MTIDTYRLTSLEDPTDSMLSQIMIEAAADAKRKGVEAHKRYFEELRKDALEQSRLWLKEHPQFVEPQ